MYYFDIVLIEILFNFFKKKLNNIKKILLNLIKIGVQKPIKLGSNRKSKRVGKT